MVVNTHFTILNVVAGVLFLGSYSLGFVLQRDQIPSGPTPMSRPVSIKYIHVYSEIQLTHGVTFIKAFLVNSDPNDRKTVEFGLTLPQEAFIKNFTISSNGVVLDYEIRYLSEVKLPKGKEVVGSVEQVGLLGNQYKISVSLEPSQALIVTLIYEEQIQRLARVNSLTYQYKLDLQSELMRTVEDFRVVVTIQEPSSIRNPIVPNMRSRTNAEKVFSLDTSNIHILNVTDNTTRISWFPDSNEVNRLIRDNCLGQFVLEYDIVTEPGEFVIGAGYILREGLRHLPSRQSKSGDSPRISKHIVFVLDISGSMEGTRLAYLKKGMTDILSQLRQADYFSIVTFSTKVHVWQALTNTSPKPVRAIPEFKSSAVNFINNITVHGSTNIFAALVQALKIAQATRNEKELDVGTEADNGQVPVSLSPLIYFLTDGEPTTGLVNRAEILRRVFQLNHQKNGRTNSTVATSTRSPTPIFTVAFGEEADYALCEQISRQNYGFARQLFENVHSPSQLVKFYTDIMKAVGRRDPSSSFSMQRTALTHYTDHRGPSYYELKDDSFRILFKTVNMSLDPATSTEVEPPAVGMNSNFKDLVAAIMTDANANGGDGDGGTPSDGCGFQPGNDAINSGLLACPSRLSPATLFRLKLFLKLELHEEVKKVLEDAINICNFIGQSMEFHEPSAELAEPGLNLSCTRLTRNVRSSYQLQLVTPCTSAVVLGRER